MSDNTVTIRVAGNDVLTFMDQVKKKADITTTGLIENAKKQTLVAKDQVKDIEAQIRAIEKRNKLEADAARATVVDNKNRQRDAARTEYEKKVEAIKADPKRGIGAKGNMISDAREAMEDKNKTSETNARDQLKTLREAERIQQLQLRAVRENIESAKHSAAEQVAAVRRGDSAIVDAVDETENESKQLTQRLALEEVGKDKKENIGKSIVGGMLSVSNLQSLMGSVNQLGASQNGFDMIQPAAKGAGNVIGSVIGGILGSILEPGGGTIIGAGIGGTIGSMVGDSVGQFQQRRMMEQQDYLGGVNKYEATTQKKFGGADDMTKMGIGIAEYIATLRQIATNTANTAMAAENTKDTIEMSKGLGVDQSTSSQMITYFRGTNKDISNLVQGVMSKGKSSLFGGGDYTFLNEFLQKFNVLHNELRNSSEKVATGTTFDILNTFNKIGGQFALRDSRSSGLISGVNSALANPATDSLKAMSFLALRKDHPNFNYSQIIEEQQKGAASPTYLKSMLKMIKEYGGDDSFQVMNSTWLTKGNVAAARRLHNNQGLVGTMSTDDIEEKYNGNFTKAAEGKTTVIEENMALIKNGLLSTWSDGVDSMVSSFKNTMTEALNGAVINIGDKGRITMGRVNTTPSNVGDKSKGTSNQVQMGAYGPYAH
jgi:hypothetical protein